MATIYNTIVLPKTTPTCYLTGMTALNIPALEGTTGDWHFDESFLGRNGRSPKFFVAGEGRALNSNPIWGALGIYDCSSILCAKGIVIAAETRVYTANHCRAILDMLYNAIQRKEYPHHITVDDWLDVDAERKHLFGDNGQKRHDGGLSFSKKLITLLRLSSLNPRCILSFCFQ